MSIILACGTGIAAMTGLLPSSKAPAAVTASPLIDSQVANAGAVASAPKAVTQHEAPLPHAVRGHRLTPAVTRAAASAAPQTAYAENTVPAYDPYADKVTAVQTAQPTTGIGAIGGAVVGGLAGTQIGNGCGRTAATLLGAIGGGRVDG
ncbi:Outer membrane lipoprotein [Candidatus Paraburkholderia calva]|nr:Outer membrane lipoprotein [Candidatus Paraburkholderia calva]